MWFGLIVGLALGYFFKPPIDVALRKVARKLTDHSSEDEYR